MGNKRAPSKRKLEERIIQLPEKDSLGTLSLYSEQTIPKGKPTMLYT